MKKKVLGALEVDLELFEGEGGVSETAFSLFLSC